VRIANALLWLAAFLPAQLAAQQAPGVIRGRVVEESGAPVAGARVAILGTARNTYSRDDGSFLLSDLPPDRYVLRAQRIGFAVPAADTVTLNAGQTIERPIVLRALPVPLSRVVISPGSYTLLDAVGTSQQMLTRDQLLSRPQLAEDLFRSLNRLPGLSGSDYSAKLRIRNGGQDELLVLLDGVELIEPFHLKDFDGALAILDAEAIDRVELSTGGFGVQYGNRMTGVVELTSASPDADRSRNSVGLSFSNVRGKSEGRFAGGRGSWLASARRGYLDVIFKLIGETDPPDPSYYDLFGKVQYQLGSRHLLSGHALVAGDALHITEDGGESRLDSRYDNAYLWSSLRSQLGDRLSATSLVSLSHLTWRRGGRTVEVFNGQPREESRIDDDRGLDAWAFKQDWAFDATPRLSVLAGGELRSERAGYDYFRVQREHVFDGQTVTLADTQQVTAHLAPSGSRLSGHAAVRARPWRRLTAELGVRADRHGWTRQTTLAPRASVAVDATPRSKLRLAFGLYPQAHTLQDLSVVDGDTGFARAELAEHRVAGVEQQLGDGWSLRAEVFERLIRHPRARWINTDGDVPLLPEATEDRLRLTPTDGRVRGLEWMASFDRGGPLRAAASYVLSKATATQDGAATPRPFDERHAIALDLAARSRGGWTWAIAWTFHSGWPMIPATFRVDTLSTGQRYVHRVPSPPLFSERLGAYHRVDMRVSRAFDVGRNRISFYAELFNLFDAENQRGTSYRARLTTAAYTVEGFEELYLPRLPSLGVRWEF
jgi:outer membrane cobalamin receptor